MNIYIAKLLHMFKDVSNNFYIIGDFAASKNVFDFDILDIS